MCHELNKNISQEMDLDRNSDSKVVELKTSKNKVRRQAAGNLAQYPATTHECFQLRFSDDSSFGSVGDATQSFRALFQRKAWQKQENLFTNYQKQIIRKIIIVVVLSPGIVLQN